MRLVAAQPPVRVHPGARPRGCGAEDRREREPRAGGRHAARPHALTIGFARRFAATSGPTSSSATRSGCARILTAAGRPVQLVFAARRTPPTTPASTSLQRIYRHALDPAFAGRVAFVEDYDLHVAHFLTQGCDVWLNTPRKPLEASGTSGMKAAMNGVPHLSIRPDGGGSRPTTGRTGGSSTWDTSGEDARGAVMLRTRTRSIVCSKRSSPRSTTVARISLPIAGCRS